MACPNGATPLLLSIQNNTVTEDGASSVRGIAVGIGNPQQVLSILPAAADHNLFVFNAADCGPASNDSCIALKGGVYDPKKSDTYVVTTEPQWNGTADPELDKEGSFIFFNEDFRYGTDGISYGFPWFMDQPGYSGQAALPLGQNSTFLEAAFTSGQAPSKVWGIWPGTRNIHDPVNGLLIIGGYDTSRVDGEFTTFPTLEDCPTCTVVTNMTYEYVGGSTSLLANSSDTLHIGLEPYAKGISLPQTMWEKFAAASLGTYDPDLSLLTYDVNNPPTGNISVTLSNGYRTTMLAEELFSKPRTFNDQGVYSITNDSVIISTVTNTTVEGYVASWGLPYLTMNYLLMDHDKKQWKMAPARRGVDDNNNGPTVSTICAPVAASTASSISSTTATAHSHKSSTGVIVGGVIAGLLGLALIICGFGFLFWRSQRKRRATNQANHQAPLQYSQHPGAVSEIGTVDNRTSIWTSTTPTEYSELASPNNGMTHNGFSPNPQVSGWLQKQGPIVEEKPYMTYATSGPMNDMEPLEMPAEQHRLSK